MGLFLGCLFYSIDFYAIFTLIPHCFDDCSFAIFSKVSESYASRFVFFPQDFFGNSGSFVVPYKFFDDLF